MTRAEQLIGADDIWFVYAKMMWTLIIHTVRVTEHRIFDHVFISKHGQDNIVVCSMLFDTSDVISENMPLQTTVSIDVCNEP